MADGAEITARFVISAVGGYVNAKPQVDIDGLADFRGDVLRPNAWDDSYDVTGKRVAVIGTGSSGVQIAAALSDSVASLDVYQRTPAWVLPKVDFDIPPVMRTLFRLPGSVRAVNALGRWLMDAAMLAPLFHVFNRLPDRVLVAAMPFYDRWSRFLYRLLLRATVDDPATRRALLPRYGIMAKRPVISSAFLPAFNRPSTSLITTPMRRITRTGVETADGVLHPADLIVTATGYELWTDPETYRPGTVLGRNGFDLAADYRANGLRAYAGMCHPQLPNRWELVGPLGFVGFAWFDFVDTMATHAVRVIAEARDRVVVAVSEAAFERVERRDAASGPDRASVSDRVQSRTEHVFRQLARGYGVSPPTDHHRLTPLRPPVPTDRLRVQRPERQRRTVMGRQGVAGMTTDLTGKVAYVTGAARGPGPLALRPAGPCRRRRRRDRRVRSRRRTQRLSAVDTRGPRRDRATGRERGPQGAGRRGGRARRAPASSAWWPTPCSSSAGWTSWSPTPAC